MTAIPRHAMKTHLQHRQLEAFRALVELGSSRAAADHLHVTQPAVSHLIRALEAAVGFALFQRRGRNLEPTPDGMLFYEEVERSFQALIGVEAQADAIRRRQVGRIRLAVIPAYADGIVAQLVGEYLLDNPSVYVEMETFEMVRVVEAVEAGRFDLGVAVLLRETPLLTVHGRFESRAVAALPARHPLAAGERLDLHDLTAEPFIAITRGSPFRYEIDAALVGLGLVPKIVAEARTQRAVLRMVAAGAGISLVDHHVAKEFSEDGLSFLPTQPRIGWKISLITKKDRPRSSALDGFIDHLKRGFEADPQPG